MGTAQIASGGRVSLMWRLFSAPCLLAGLLDGFRVGGDLIHLRPVHALLILARMSSLPIGLVVTFLAANSSSSAFPPSIKAHPFQSSL